MNSFIAWVGGKKQLRKRILGHFPSGDEIGRYIEVFGGAGWVLFGKEQGRCLEVFNDADGNQGDYGRDFGRIESKHPLVGKSGRQYDILRKHEVSGTSFKGSI